MIDLDTFTGYGIISHGGIGDEQWEDSDRERPKHNLSWSCHELRVFFNGEVTRIIIDMWSYQWRGKLNRDIQKIAAGVKTIILTHPHMDHIGDLPLACTEDSEFEWKIYSTPGTKKSAEIALVDSAKILAREFEKKSDGYIKMLQEIAGALLTIKKNQPGEKQVKKNKRNGDRIEQTGKTRNKTKDNEWAEAILRKYGVDTTSNEWYKSQMEKNAPIKPPYSLEDVQESLWKIELHTVKKWWKEILPWKIAFRFYNAGHIAWSVSVLFRITQNRKQRYVLFSWDLGSYKWDFHPTGLPVPPHDFPIETTMIESTYGNKPRPDFEIWLQDFEDNLVRDLAKYGQVIISTFAQDRTPNLLYRTIKMKLEWKIDADIILDTPSGTKHTINSMEQAHQIDDTILSTHVPSIHRALRKDFIEKEEESLREFAEYINPAYGHYEIATKMNRDSLFADNWRPKIIFTASGMGEGGRIISHLEENLWNPNIAFYFPGYLVPGTLGYSLADANQPGWQQKRVKIWAATYDVKARIKQFNFLSWHGDADDLRTWLGAINIREGSNIMVVHGDKNWSSLEFKHSLERTWKYTKRNIIVPWIEEEYFFPFEKEIKAKPNKPKPKAKKISKE